MSEDYRVLLTGSGDWTNEDLITIALSAMVIASRAAGRRLVLVHGGCPRGADAIADRIARKLGIPRDCIEKHPAKWDIHGKPAGMIRNKEMVDEGADVCLAFIMPCTRKGCAGLKRHGSHGTTHCVKLAEHACIPVRGFGFGFPGN